jgi:hypothetical protein
VYLTGDREAGLLFINDAYVETDTGAKIDVTGILSSLIIDGELILTVGSHIPSVDMPQDASAASWLMIDYRINGQNKKRAWRLAGNLVLQEPLELIAPGQIVEMDEVASIERLFADFFLNIKCLQRRISLAAQSMCCQALVDCHSHSHSLTHSLSLTHSNDLDACGVLDTCS